MPWELATKQDVVNIHPVSISELKDEWSAEVEALIRQHMGQPYLGASRVITDEYHDGDGSYILMVAKPPILSIQSLTVDSIQLTPAEYVAFDSYVELRPGYLSGLPIYFSKGILNVKISYTSGSMEMDEVVRLTAAAMIVAIVNYRKRWGADASLKWGAADQKAGEESPNMNVGLTSHLATIMKRLLRRPTLRVR